MRILIIDDQHERHGGFRDILAGHRLTHAFGYSEAIADMSHNRYDMVCLGHDLALNDIVEGRALTGHDIAKWLVSNPGRCPPQILVHSHNQAGASRIEQELQRLSVNLVLKPFSYAMAQ